MTTLYVCTFDCDANFRLMRHDFEGPSYPREKSKVKITTLASCPTLHPRKQEAQWHGGSDAEAMRHAEALAADYSMVDG